MDGCRKKSANWKGVNHFGRDVVQVAGEMPMQVDTLVLRLSVQALMPFLSQVYQHLLFTSLEMEPLLNYEMPPIFGEKIVSKQKKP